MTKKILLPFTTLILEDAADRQADFFERLFFTDHSFKSDRFQLTIKFVPVRPDRIKYNLEEDVAADRTHLYLADTALHWTKLALNKFTPQSLTIMADPEFDLYYLFITVIEPLIIIASAYHGGLYVHASGMVDQGGRAQLFSAWRHTGKTKLMFELAAQGYRFLGDDYCVVARRQAYLYPKSINIFSYNFEQQPFLFRSFGMVMTIKLKLMIELKKLLTWFSRLLPMSLGKAVFRVSQLTEAATNLQTTPAKLGLIVARSAPLGSIQILLKSGAGDQLHNPHDSGGIHRLETIVGYELSLFWSLYQKFQFLFPTQSNRYLENFPAQYQKILKKVLTPRPGRHL